MKASAIRYLSVFLLTYFSFSFVFGSVCGRFAHVIRLCCVRAGMRTFGMAAVLHLRSVDLAQRA